MTFKELALKMLKEYPESINFLIKTNYYHCQIMKELIDQDDSGFLTLFRTQTASFHQYSIFSSFT